MRSTETQREQPLIRVENNDGIFTLYIDRPEKRNAMNPEMHRQMHRILSELRFDPKLRVLVITGVGESFCAGQDIKEYLHDLDPQEAAAERDRMRTLSNEWRNHILRLFPAPTIAAVNGWCFGGGLSIVCSCDIAIAAEDATFGLSEINFRGVPGGVTRGILETLRPRESLYYALTGKPFDGKRAAEIGLVTMAVPKERLMEEVYEHAVLLKTKDAVALRETKETFKHASSMNYEAAFSFTNAKVNEANFLQGRGGVHNGVDDFLQGKIKPGLGA